MKPLRALIRDLLPLLWIHAALLTGTLLASIVGIYPVKSPLGDSIIGDTKLQVAWTLFLVPGWLIAARWTPSRATVLRRYFAAAASSVAIHAVLSGVCATLGHTPQSYLIGFSVLAVVSVVDRIGQISKPRGKPFARRLVQRSDLVLIIAVMLFSIAVYRTPRSNDIRQFVLQQQDMVAQHSLRVSPIGMTAMGVDEPMPRWRAHLWHALPCILSVATTVPVDQILLRYGTIPLATTVLLCLWFIVFEIARAKQNRWLAMLAILGPVLLWYRSYNAFNYSFRLTNNFWLDKDFCLFFLIPATTYLAYQWIRGKKHFAGVLLMLMPAILKFHPMNAVYLILLLPMIAVWSAPRFKGRQVRLGIVSVAAIFLFLSVLWIGDAQSYHREIREIVTLDYADHQTGRPLHYWTGLYGAIPEAGLELDTTRWSGNVFHLKASLIMGCGLLVVSHGCLALAMFWLPFIRRSHRTRRVFWELLATLMILWGIVFGSRFVLTAAPHLSGGVERLHWFAYLPCLVGVTSTLSLMMDAALKRTKKLTIQRAGTLLIASLVTFSASIYAAGHQTSLNHLRGVNSLLDFDLPYNRERQEHVASKTLDQNLLATKPPYLRDDDVVLFLETKGKDTYWWIKQGVFWSDSYAEAFALHERGESFMTDREYFYAMVDRLTVDRLQPWLDRKGITLIVDRRSGADEYLQNIVADGSLDAACVQSGVWRVLGD